MYSSLSLRPVFVRDPSQGDGGCGGALGGAQGKFRGLRGLIAEPWDLLVSCRKDLPLRMRTPMPRAVVEGIFRWATCKGLGSDNSRTHLWVRFAVAMKVGFLGLFPPSELCGLLPCCISLPADTMSLTEPCETPRAVLVIVSPKNWRHAGRRQTAWLNDEATIGWLAWLVDGLDDVATVFPSLAQMRRLLAHSLDALHLQGLHLGMASLRAGGTTDLFRRCQNLPVVQYAGRWSSLLTLLHYIQEASATQTM